MFTAGNFLDTLQSWGLQCDHCGFDLVWRSTGKRRLYAQCYECGWQIPMHVIVRYATELPHDHYKRLIKTDLETRVPHKQQLGDDLWIINGPTAEIAGEGTYPDRERMPAYVGLEVVLNQSVNGYEKATITNKLYRSGGLSARRYLALLQSENHRVFVDEEYIPFMIGYSLFIRGEHEPVFVKRGDMGKTFRIILPVRFSQEEEETK